jgi:hypothetical protein
MKSAERLVTVIAADASVQNLHKSASFVMSMTGVATPGRSPIRCSGWFEDAIGDHSSSAKSTNCRFSLLARTPESEGSGERSFLRRQPKLTLIERSQACFLIDAKEVDELPQRRVLSLNDRRCTGVSVEADTVKRRPVCRWSTGAGDGTRHPCFSASSYGR